MGSGSRANKDKKKLGRYSGALALVLVPRYSILHTTLHYPAAPAVHY